MTYLEDNCMTLREKLLNSTFLIVFERKNCLTERKMLLFMKVHSFTKQCFHC